MGPKGAENLGGIEMDAEREEGRERKEEGTRTFDH